MSSQLLCSSSTPVHLAIEEILHGAEGGHGVDEHLCSENKLLGHLHFHSQTMLTSLSMLHGTPANMMPEQSGCLVTNRYYDNTNRIQDRRTTLTE